MTWRRSNMDVATNLCESSGDFLLMIVLRDGGARLPPQALARRSRRPETSIPTACEIPEHRILRVLTLQHFNVMQSPLYARHVDASDDFINSNDITAHGVHETAQAKSPEYSAGSQTGIQLSRRIVSEKGYAWSNE